jgi:hypothetical protein
LGVILTLLLTGWVGNTISSYVVQAFGAISKTGPVWTIVRFVHGILNQVDPEVQTTKDFKIPSDGAVKFGLIFVLSCLAGLSQTACGGSLHSTIETIMVFQAEVHTEQAQVLLAANAAIATLPADQQQAALSALNSANDKLTAALNTKDAALQAALDASDASGINIQQIESDIMIAVNAVVSLIQTFGVAEQTQRAQAAATRLLAARTPVVHK